jgi:hypothetical protein
VLGKRFNGIKHGTESGALPLNYAYTSVLLAINHGIGLCQGFDLKAKSGQ